MKDLKNMIFFENLLDDPDNELVKKAQDDGGVCLGYTCYYVPEVLLNVDKCFSTRLRAPRTGSIDIATYSMSNYTCEFCRSILERAIEGGYEFLDALCEPDACSAMNRMAEHFEILQLNKKPNFFVTHLETPYKVEDYTVDMFETQVQEHILNQLEEKYGVDISDAAIRKAVEEHNEVCQIMTELSDLRKLDNPPITGYEYAVICLVTYTCPKALILPYLRDTLAEVKKRKPDPKPWYRAHVEVVGSEIDDPELIKMMEESGAFVVADRYCFGTFPGRQVIPLDDNKPALHQVIEYYMRTSECARWMAEDKIQQRHDTVDTLAKEFKADGIIYEQMKYCDFWGFERTMAGFVLKHDYGWPVLSIDRGYQVRGSGQLRTRFQAFVEALEIKKIKEAKKEGVTA